MRPWMDSVGHLPQQLRHLGAVTQPSRNVIVCDGCGIDARHCTNEHPRPARLCRLFAPRSQCQGAGAPSVAPCAAWYRTVARVATIVHRPTRTAQTLGNTGWSS